MRRPRTDHLIQRSLLLWNPSNESSLSFCPLSFERAYPPATCNIPVRRVTKETPHGVRVLRLKHNAFERLMRRNNSANLMTGIYSPPLLFANKRTLRVQILSHKSPGLLLSSSGEADGTVTDNLLVRFRVDGLDDERQDACLCSLAVPYPICPERQCAPPVVSP